MVRAAQKGEAKAPSPEVSRVASRIKKSDAKDFASTKHKGLPMKKKGLSEEGYDRMRDAALEKGTWKGGGGQPSTGGAKKTKGKTVLQKETEKKYGKGKSALDIVKKNITDKYGKDAIMKTKNEGTSYGITRGSGKPSGQMAAFGKQDKKENPYSIKNKLKMVIKGAAEKNRKKAGVTSEAVYTGPDKKDRAVIKKMDNKDFAKKAAEYEKNMDPKKRQELKDKATKGMKFTVEAMSSYDRNRKAAAKRAAARNAERRAGKRGGRMEGETYRTEGGVHMHHKGYKAEGMSYGLYKGSGKPSGPMAAFGKKNKLNKPETKKKKVQSFKKFKAGQEPASASAPDMSEATLATARKNIGRDPKKKSCWKGYKATGTKMKDGRAVPDCKPA